jgi:hypothetical protein
VTPRDHIDREIVRMHGEGCTRQWIAQQVGLSSSALQKRCTRLGLSFEAHSHRMAVLCVNGHNARVLGHRDGCCTVCGDRLVVPPGLMAARDGQIRHDATASVRIRCENPREREVDYAAVLALEVRRESTPHYLRHEIDDQIRRLRA